MDRRGTFAVLTPAGLEARKKAWSVYRAAVEEHFAAKMTPEEAKGIFEVLVRMSEGKPLIGYEAD
jgi:DNA-binding MarR family transcriptional regulator